VSVVEVIEGIGKAIDAIGVAVIAGGAILAVFLTIGRIRQEDSGAYEFFRRRLGRAILLGLEFLVAADIIRTVAVTPSAESVAVLGGIVLIRTFLSFSLQLEVTGAWPWQQRSIAAADKTRGTPSTKPLSADAVRGTAGSARRLRPAGSPGGSGHPRAG
jgi:uncharacterized membrane protein